MIEILSNFLSKFFDFIKIIILLFTFCSNYFLMNEYELMIYDYAT